MQHYALINWSNLNNGWLQSAGDTYSYSLDTGTIAYAEQVVDKTSTTDIATIRPPHLEEYHYIHPRTTELIRYMRQSMVL